MFVRGVCVPKGIGLHSKSATLFVSNAKKYKSFIWLKFNNSLVNAKSLFEVLALDVSGEVLIEISADGIDEEQAVEELVELIKNLD